MLMVASNATGAFALGSIPVALALGHLPFAQIMVVASYRAASARSSA
jgi:hypothetical protein